MTHVCPFDRESQDFPEAPVNFCFHFSGWNCVTWPALEVMEAGKGEFSFPNPCHRVEQGRRGLGMGLGLTETWCCPTGLLEELGKQYKSMGFRWS